MDRRPDEHPGEQSMLALLLERTEQGFWFIDNELQTTDANPAMCRMLCTTRECMLGKNIYAFVDDANAAVFRHHVRLRAMGQAEGYEITLQRADGTAVHCWNNAAPVYDEQGRKTGAVGMFSDISALKEAERQVRISEARFRNMADGAPALIWHSDLNGTPRWFNQRWLSYTGRSLAAELAQARKAGFDDYVTKPATATGVRQQGSGAARIFRCRLTAALPFEVLTSALDQASGKGRISVGTS